MKSSWPLLPSLLVLAACGSSKPLRSSAADASTGSGGVLATGGVTSVVPVQDGASSVGMDGGSADRSRMNGGSTGSPGTGGAAGSPGAGGGPEAGVAEDVAPEDDLVREGGTSSTDSSGAVSEGGAIDAEPRLPSGEVVLFCDPKAAVEDLTFGPDGSLWLAEAGGTVERFVNDHVVQQLSVHASLDYRSSIAFGPDGNLWVSDSAGSIYRLSQGGTVQAFPLPGSNRGLAKIVAGPDGNLWYIDWLQRQIGRITPTGDITETPLVYEPESLALGPDGNLWFVGSAGSGKDAAIGDVINHFGEVSLSGELLEITHVASNGIVRGLAGGPDGALWFFETGVSSLFRMTTSGSVSEFPLPTPGTSIRGVAAGSDGNLWFTEDASSSIGRMTTTGVVTDFAVGSGARPETIIAGPDRNLWFTNGNNCIGRITP